MLYIKSMTMTAQKATFNDLPDLVSQLCSQITILTEKVDTLTASKPQEQVEILTIDDAAKVLGMSKQSLYGMTSRGEIPFHKRPDGRKLYFLKSELISWIANGSK